LLRRALHLADDVSRSDHVKKDAFGVEVWFAIAVPVMQGYWRSRIAEGRKKKVLDSFHRAMLNIIFNDVFTPSQAIQKIRPDAHDLFHSKVINDLNQQIQKRIEEYNQAMNAFFTRQGPGNMPVELIEALIHNLFEDPHSPKKKSTEYADKDPDRFMEVMTLVAIPMISAFTDCIKG
jgi:hypothetical protein